MNLLKTGIFFLLLAACAPYTKGPIFIKENAVHTFQPLVKFMEIKPGMTVADVAAGSGALSYNAYPDG